MARDWQYAEGFIFGANAANPIKFSRFRGCDIVGIGIKMHKKK